MDIKQLRIKNIDVYSMMFSGFLYLGLGILFLTQKPALIFAVESLLNLMIVLFIVSGIFQILGFSLIENKRINSLSRIFGFIINMTMAAVIYFKAKLVVSIFPIFFGIYALIAGIIRLLIYIQYKKNNIKGRYFIILEFIVLVFFGIIIIMHPLLAILPISNMIGIFFILYGISFLIDALLDGVPQEAKDSFKRRVRISLPVFMVALIPHSILLKINKAFETEEIHKDDLIDLKEDAPFDLEVLIHVAAKGVGALGHVDICFEDKVLTYGSYDEHTYKLAGIISDGIFMEVDSKENYIKFSQREKKKTMFGFGLRLTEEQKERVREKIAHIHKDLYRWKSKSEIDQEKGIVRDKPAQDYASILHQNLRGRMYKFKSGPFKTYFALNTNCVLLADKIVGQAGIDIVKIQGLISPGAYFEYFNREFLKENSFVISRTIYYDENKSKEEKI